MPRPRGRGKKVNYVEPESCSSDEEEIPSAMSGMNMLTGILGLILQNQTPRRRRTSSGKPRKRKQPSDDCQSHCHCCHCKKSAPKKQSGTKRERKSKKVEDNAPKPSTSASKDDSIDVDSDDEEINPTITENQASNIRNKVDTFFKALESDDEEFEDKLRAEKAKKNEPSEPKPRQFYSLSDSEDEIYKNKEKEDTKEESPVTISTLNMTGDNSVLSTGLKTIANSLNISNEKKTENLFAYVDDILNECNEVIDITSDKPKENVLSLEDLKKKTDEILGDVATLIDDFNPKPKEPEKTATNSPVKEAPICPICLEQLGGSRQAMATLCGHMFCEPCILQVVKTTKKCPACRKGLTKTKYHPVYI